MKNQTKIKRHYNNYTPCKNCKTKKKKINDYPQNKHIKTITEYSSKMQKAMTHKNEKKQEYKNEYAKKSSVEGPFGILKEQFQIEKKVVIGK